MISPNQIIGITAPPELKNYIKPHHKILNVHVDLKNVMTALFVNDVAEEMIMNSENMGAMDSTIFQGVLYTTAYWKWFAKQNNMECRILIATDLGDSAYHLSINRKYKCRRKVSSVASPMISGGGIDDKLKQIRDNNFVICENIVNRIKDVHFFALRFLESDFLCHYLINEKYPEEENFHLILSSDKDMYQTITNPNIVQLYKHRGDRRLYDQSTVMSKYVGFDKKTDKAQSKFLPKLKKFDMNFVAGVMALVGDAGDDVPGVRGIGPGKSLEIFTEDGNLLQKMIGTIDELNERVASGGLFFLEDAVPLKHMNNALQSCFLENTKVTEAYKMISYDQLVTWLKKKDKTEKKDWLEYIDTILSKGKHSVIESLEAFMKGLENVRDNKLTEEQLKILFE